MLDTRGPQSRERINFCYLKPPGFRSFVTAALRARIARDPRSCPSKAEGLGPREVIGRVGSPEPGALAQNPNHRPLRLPVCLLLALLPQRRPRKGGRDPGGFPGTVPGPPRALDAHSPHARPLTQHPGGQSSPRYRKLRYFPGGLGRWRHGGPERAGCGPSVVVMAFRAPAVANGCAGIAATGGRDPSPGPQ